MAEKQKPPIVYLNADKEDNYILVKAIVIPAKYIISEDDQDDVRKRRQYTRAELVDLDLGGLSVKYEHNGKTNVGYVIDSGFVSDGSYQVLIEIPPVSPSDKNYTTKQAARSSLVGLLLSNVLVDVSLHHRAVVHNIPGKVNTFSIVREILEVSFVSEGGRAGSHILKVAWNSNSAKGVVTMNSIEGLVFFLNIYVLSILQIITNLFSH